jgi:ankyrin repeat protein
MQASQEGRWQIVPLLLAAKADVNAQLSNGANALMLASQMGQLRAVHALLAAKPDVNAKAANGATAMTLASKYQHQEVIKILKEAGAK